MILTVTLNPAIDRTLTVPNFQRGQRHRATSGLPLAGGKGINISRALKALGVPSIATGLTGGQTGMRIVERLTAEGILNDFVRIADESRTTTAVVDPTSGSYTEIKEWGPAVRPDELGFLRDKVEYLSRSADVVVIAGSLPRDVADSFYAELIHDLNRRNVATYLDCEGEALRLGVEAEPTLASISQQDAESLVGQEFHDDEDYELALEQISALGAKNALISTEDGCIALLREDRVAHRFRVVAPRVEPVSTVGAGDVLLAGFLAARAAGKAPEETLRLAVAASTASTLELGAGILDPREAGRLQPATEVVELQPATEVTV